MAAPAQDTSASAHPVAASSGWTRISRYAPAATMVAECSRADTGLGPAIARASQNENGSCADFPSADTTIPAATRSRQGPSARASASSRSEPAPASANPAAA